MMRRSHKAQVAADLRTAARMIEQQAPDFEGFRVMPLDHVRRVNARHPGVWCGGFEQRGVPLEEREPSRCVLKRRKELREVVPVHLGWERGGTNMESMIH